MRRKRTGADFGFPRWGGYGRDSDAVHVRMCDFHGCNEAGEHPAPKSTRTNDRWYFCERHAADYNRNWNFFAGMSDEAVHDYMRREQEQDGATGYRQSQAFSWGGTPDADGLTRAERDAFDVLDLEPVATGEEIKSRFRSLAKQYHPDRNPGDKEAAVMFHQVRVAYDVLKPRIAEGV
ncbi:molecular chaperone DnaJ [Iodidimonas nitroreducens]|uniref:Molecular chaperone DnaJ n=1 Tax=Iodidimonas nitroreducens TaxID=1236968 RepID=A0A5A7NCK2_9PROT|nr:J domain-containing protein [Iodidimonas nitroreducens]GAK34507.1 chaperone protein DnaJ [alpha proteobacterium Q-1]GER05454.1 molecular chaperone DnaJ [Iodidimonas nitroreducens]